MSDLREQLIEAGVKGEWATDWCDDPHVVMGRIADEILAVIASAGFELADTRWAKVTSKDLVCVHMETLMRTPQKRKGLTK